MAIKRSEFINTRPNSIPVERNQVQSNTGDLEFNRKVKGEQTLNHDLFRLELSYMKKNIGLPHAPKWDNVPHIHYFHTRDSNGKKQMYASSIGGHTHEVTIEVINGEPVAKCGPAIPKRYGGKESKTKLEVRALDYDNHTHDIYYLSSHEITTRKWVNDPAFNQAINSHVIPEAPRG